MALAAVVALALAGCTGVSPRPAATSATATTPASAAVTDVGPPPSAGVQRSYGGPPSVLAAPGPNQRRAVADVGAILARFLPPPGARRLPRAPGGSWWELDRPGGTGRYYSVTDTSWWQVPGPTKAIASWEKAHMRGFSVYGPSFMGPVQVRPEASPPPGRLPAFPPVDMPPGEGPTPKPANVYDSWTDIFSLPQVPGVLTERDLMVEAFTNHLGQVYVRVDAQVTWNEDRAASERVPATTWSVTFSALLGSGRPATAGRPVTVTDQGEVTRIVAVLNGLPVYSGGACIPVPTDGIRLVFRNASGQLLGAAVVPSASCTLQLSLAGQARQPGLADNPDLVPDLLRIAGIRWSLS